LSLAKKILLAISIEFIAVQFMQPESKLNGIANSIKDDIMPLSSYKLIHKKAQLGTDEKRLVYNWAQLSIDSLSIKN